LSPGDIVVLYSDGVTDTQNSSAQFYGWQRLSAAVSSQAALSSAEIADYLLTDVDEFTGGRHPFDDRTLVVLKVI
jgi:phosphoserine phosphatase RsbU/P